MLGFMPPVYDEHCGLEMAFVSIEDPLGGQYCWNSMTMQQFDDVLEYANKCGGCTLIFEGVAFTRRLDVQKGSLDCNICELLAVNALLLAQLKHSAIIVRIDGLALVSRPAVLIRGMNDNLEGRSTNPNDPLRLLFRWQIFHKSKRTRSFERRTRSHSGSLWSQYIEGIPLFRINAQSDPIIRRIVSAVFPERNRNER